MQGLYLQLPLECLLSQLSYFKQEFHIEKVIVEKAPFHLEYDEAAYINKCPLCSCIRNLKVACTCQDRKYCSSQCKEIDELAHLPKCEASRQIDLDRFSFTQRNEHSMNGKVGLDNLGLTCYMNSALQCLSKITMLRDYFLDGRFKLDVNMVNKFGSKGEVVCRFAELLDKIWNQKQKVARPTHLWVAIGRKNDMFKE
jgi:ubiquitin carboxyl-terminal hydrolase 4/11